MCQPRSPFLPRRARRSLSFHYLRSSKHQTRRWNSAESFSHSVFFLVASLWPEYYESLPWRRVHQGSHFSSAAAHTWLPETTPSWGAFPGESLINNRPAKKACGDGGSLFSSAFLPTFWGQNDWNFIFGQTLPVSVRPWRLLRQVGRWFLVTENRIDGFNFKFR